MTDQVRNILFLTKYNRYAVYEYVDGEPMFIDMFATQHEAEKFALTEYKPLEPPTTNYDPITFLKADTYE